MNVKSDQGHVWDCYRARAHPKYLVVRVTWFEWGRNRINRTGSPYSLNPERSQELLGSLCFGNCMAILSPGFRVSGVWGLILGLRLGTAPPQYQLLENNHNMVIYSP